MNTFASNQTTLAATTLAAAAVSKSRVGLLGLLLLLLAAWPQQGLAQSRVGTTAAPFLTLGTGARGQALGQAYSTQATGADALFWNPAGAARAYQGRYRSNLFATHHNWFADIDYNAVGLTIPVGVGTLGLSATFVDYGELDLRTERDQEDTGQTFGASDLAIGITYARPLTESFYFGGTAKFIRQGIYDMAAQTVAFDFGFVLESAYFNGLVLSATIMNFGGKMQMEGVNAQVAFDPDPNQSGNNNSTPAEIQLESWDLPLAFKFGMSYPVARVDAVELRLMAEADQTNDNNLNGDLGAQLRYATGAFTLDGRVGYKDLFLDDAVDSHFTFGGGVAVRVADYRVAFDYAYTPFDFLDATQMIDVRVFF
ncbi:MAG: PorV/PorQ family protein [Bacteroidota bacterium]